MEEKKQKTIVLIAFFVVAFLLRIAGASGDLWFDEAWSVVRATNAATPWSFLLAPAHDNDHPLNSVWLHLVGSSRHPLVLRALALAGSAITFGSLASLATDLRRGAQFAFLALLTLSYPLVLYGSEARGYSIALAGVSLVVASSSTATPSRLRVALRSGAAVFALLGHLTAVFPLVAIGAADALTALRSPGRRLEILATHGPWIGLLALWLLPALSMDIGGGPTTSVGAALYGFVALVLGFEQGVPGLGETVAVLGAAASIVAALFWAGKESALLFVFAVGFAVATAIHRDYGSPHPRYFVAALPVAFAALAKLLERAPRLSPALVLLLAATQIPNVSALVLRGRGQIGKAVAAIEARSANGAKPRVLIDHRRRLGTLLDFYGEAGLVRLERPSREVDYLLIHSTDGEARFPPTLRRGALAFRRDESWAAAPYSGLHLALYKRTLQTTAPARRPRWRQERKLKRRSLRPIGEAPAPFGSPQAE